MKTELSTDVSCRVGRFPSLVCLWTALQHRLRYFSSKNWGDGLLDQDEGGSLLDPWVKRYKGMAEPGKVKWVV